MHVLTCVTGRVDCFGCVCVPPRLKDKVRFVLQYMSTYGHVLFVNLLVSYAVVRQISMLFIDNKDCVFCKAKLKTETSHFSSVNCCSSVVRTLSALFKCCSHTFSIVQVLFAHFQHCSGAVRTLSALFRCCSHTFSIVQVLFAHFQHCSGAVRTLSALFRCCSHTFSIVQVLFAHFQVLFAHLSIVQVLFHCDHQPPPNSRYQGSA